jgi:hypothetical protein
VALSAPARARDVALYAAVAIAIVALVVAAYAATRPAPETAPLPPTASVTVRLVDAVTVDAPGAHRVGLGWIYVDRAPAIVQLSANYSYVWFLLDGVYHGNPATAILTVGNHTVDAVISVTANGTRIKIDYKVLG